MAALRQILHRRAILAYFLTIVAPALVLLYLGLQSVDRRHRAIDTLRASNLRLSGEKLAAELDRRTAELAAECLREVSSSPPGRERFEETGRRHPVARHFFLLEEGVVRYPPVSTPPPDIPDGLPQAFRKAEDLEFRQQRVDLALAAYRSIPPLPVPDAVKALAMSRVARCLEKLNRREEAAEVWRTLMARFGDLYDPSHRPYGLIAGIELGQRELVLRDLVRGRWELSAEQVDYFLERLKGVAPVQDTEYLRRLRFARALQENFHHYGSLEKGETHAYAFEEGGVEYRTFYTLASAEGGRKTIVGFAANQEWVQERLLPECRAALRMSDEVLPVRAGDPDPQPPAGGARRDLLVYGATTTLVLGLLVMGVILLIRDVAREMRVNQLRAEFVSGVSHELKTPLTLIRLYGETLQQGGDFSDDERRGFYQIITRESERLSHLIDRVLTFSRIERGEKQYRLQEGDLAPVIGRTVEAYDQYLKRRGFTVETRLASQAPPVRFDADGVSQAVVNLLDNAVKYSGESRYIGIRLHAADGRVIFEVEDRGIGIPPSEQEQIFQRFYRSPNASRGGYGLGLFLVRHIMEAHGGRVELDSEVGRGSRFCLVFPVAS